MCYACSGVERETLWGNCRLCRTVGACDVGMKYGLERGAEETEHSYLSEAGFKTEKAFALYPIYLYNN